MTAPQSGGDTPCFPYPRTAAWGRQAVARIEQLLQVIEEWEQTDAAPARGEPRRLFAFRTRAQKPALRVTPPL